MVRPLARGRAAPADRGDARARDRPLDAARDQHRDHRGHRRAAAAIVARLPEFTRGTLEVEWCRARGATPYVRCGQRPGPGPRGTARRRAPAPARSDRGGAKTSRIHDLASSRSPMLTFQQTHPHAAGLLGPAGLRAAAALRHGSRRRHLPHRDLPARARARALARGLRAALAPPEGRPLRREPEPAAALLPVPGGAQALARRHPRALPRLARGARLRPRSTTTCASSRTTGRTPRSARGAWAGKCG